MAEQKPLVAAAFVCERVLNEKNVYSAIRIVDTFTLKVVSLKDGKELPASDEDMKAAESGDAVIDASRVIDMSALVLVRAGEITGKHEMTLSIRNPAGKENKLPHKLNVDFQMNDPAEAASMTIRFMMPGNAAAGRYWMNVFWDGEELTRIPFKLVKESKLPETPSPEPTTEGM